MPAGESAVWMGSRESVVRVVTYESGDHPVRVVLPDGRELTRPTVTHPMSLRIGDWIAAVGGPRRVRDLRSRPDGGRIVHLVGALPLMLGTNERVIVYTLQIPGDP